MGSLRRHFTPEQLAAAEARVRDGERWLDIAAALNATPLTLRFHMQRFGYCVIHPNRSSRWRRQSITIPTEPTTLAYLAGLLDGEGYISVRRTNQWVVSITNTHFPTLEWIRSMVGGSINVKYDGGRRRPCGQWAITRGADVLAFLTACRPYLRIKAAKADEGIRILSSGFALKMLRKGQAMDRLDAAITHQQEMAI